MPYSLELLPIDVCSLRLIDFGSSLVRRDVFTDSFAGGIPAAGAQYLGAMDQDEWERHAQVEMEHVCKILGVELPDAYAARKGLETVKEEEEEGEEEVWFSTQCNTRGPCIRHRTL